MKAIKELEVELDSSKIEDDEHMHKYWPMIGIADACLQNENYKKMLAEVEIASFANIDALKWLIRNYNKKRIRF